MFSATDGTWRDVHMLAMLDTDWTLMESRTAGRASISTPWDTLMERHEKEREEMSEWMDDPSWGKLRRIGSTETIKGAIEPDVDDVVAEPSANAGAQNTLSENDRIGIPGESFYVEADYGFNDLYSEEDDDYNLAISDSNFQSASSWIPDDYASPALGSQVSSPPAPASSLGISPPASVISLPSDFEWRSIGQSSEPSVISAAPSTTSHASWSQVSPPPPNGAGVSSPPIFSLDEDELIDGSPSDLEGEGLGFGLEPRRGH
ncbi:hypothetical protein FRC12_017264 [Ceratobasidium sp. 428]|nr:hypothetical protein FRC12_017264 [Ceratobasidium sp. 428]